MQGRVTIDPETLQSSSEYRSPRTWYHKTFQICRNHAGFVGPGILASVAYFDPGNWATDLAAGSEYGYSLLFVVLCAGLGAILFQVLSCRLGIVTGKDLAQHLRIRFHSRPKNTLLWRWGILYPLYAVSEIAIIATDMAEALGSAIALNLIFPKLPLYAGVLITAADVMIILVAYRPDGGARSMRTFEVIIACLVLAVFISFLVLLVRIQPDWPDVFKGYLPSKVLVAPGALYTSIGIIGATVMPHALFLGSRLSTIDRLTPTPSASARSSATDLTAVEPDLPFLDRSVSKLKKILTHVEADEKDELRKVAVEANSDCVGVGWIRTHLTHATVDIVLSLFCFAITINSAILIVAATSFYYRHNSSSEEGVGDLFAAYALIKQYVSKGSAFLFAFALLCAGQSASITATLAGQVVSEGFLRWKLSPFLRRLVTRLISMTPAIIVSVALGRQGLDTLLVASQVILSIVLPFVVFPLVFFTSSKSGLMRVKVERNTTRTAGIAAKEMAECPSPTTVPLPPSPSQCTITDPTVPPAPQPPAEADEGDEYADFSSAWYVTALGYLIFVIMLAANCYVLVQLGRGQS
ncbi:hypothetical protein FRC04_004113 [Tulasnella sp. 424]|nr:hypothetical protein FRC04_004113 [Tulasnella sp. 424]KAG8964961.1 hypothetical protein FRC05_003528 [Tulasnella sp. 425]